MMQLSPSTKTWAIVAVAFLVQVAPWPTMQVNHLSVPHMQLNTRTGFPLQLSRVNNRNSLKRCLKNSEMDKVDDIVDQDVVDWQPGISEKRKIEITSEIDLPCSPEVAYDIYSDLTRQPSWSSWLHSVEYLLGNDDGEQQQQQSKWTLKYLGVQYSWIAKSTKNVRPHIVQWESTSGLRNFGTVRFEQQQASNDGGMMTTPNTKMKMKMTFVAPRAVSFLFRRSTRLASFVKEKMILASMLEFRQVVLQEVDLNRMSPTSPREKKAMQ
jgi:uncharacterized membrane protein